MEDSIHILLLLEMREQKWRILSRLLNRSRIALSSSEVKSSQHISSLLEFAMLIYSLTVLLNMHYLTVFLQAGWGYATDFGGAEESYYPEMGMTSYVRRRKMKRLQTFSREYSIFLMLTYFFVLRSFLVQ